MFRDTQLATAEWTPKMGSKLYVGNLSYSTNEETLRAVFEADGRQVQNVSIIMDRETGRSRGFGFVQMASAEQAEAAMKALDGFAVDGRSLRVTEAREREQRGGSRPPARGAQERRGNGTSPRVSGERAPGPRPFAAREDRVEPRGSGFDNERPALVWGEPDSNDGDNRGRGGRGGRNHRRSSDQERNLERDFDRKPGRSSRGRNRNWKRDWEL